MTNFNENETGNTYQQEPEYVPMALEIPKKKNGVFVFVGIFLGILIGLFILATTASITWYLNQDKVERDPREVKIEKFVDSNEMEEAFEYYIDNYSNHDKNVLQTIIEGCVINEDYDTLLDITHKIIDLKIDETFYYIVEAIDVKLKEDDYETYCDKIINTTIFDEYDFEQKLFLQYHLLSPLPKEYEDANIYREVYTIIAGNTVGRTYDIPEITSSMYRDLALLCDYQPLNAYMVETEGFMTGRWSNDAENYLEFSYDGMGAHCNYNFPNTDWAEYPYYAIEDGVYNLYKSKNSNEKTAGFAIKIIDKDTLEVYNYNNQITYQLERE